MLVKMNIQKKYAIYFIDGKQKLLPHCTIIHKIKFTDIQSGNKSFTMLF